MRLVIIQARMSSQRLPGKVLRVVGGVTLLECMLRRVQNSRLAQRIVVATSKDSTDDPIAAFCKGIGVYCYRGSLHNVLLRFANTAVAFEGTTIVRLTADCPLIDPKVIDHILDFYGSHDYDYVANRIPAPGTYPDGMDVEVFSRSALEHAYANATEPYEREHVTPYIWRRPELFTQHRVDRTGESWGHYRLTVDHPDDLVVIEELIQRYYFKTPFFTMEQMVAHIQEKQK